MCFFLFVPAKYVRVVHQQVKARFQLCGACVCVWVRLCVGGRYL